MHRVRSISIAALGAVLLALVWRGHTDRIATAKAEARAETAARARDLSQQVERVFERVYVGIRTMSRLPGVRSIDRYAKNFDADARTTVQELYNALATDVAMSEVYIVPVDLDPDLLDPVTGEPQEPIITFDELIIGRHAESGHEEHGEAEVEEIEIYEYRLMKQQLAWFKEHAPRENDVKGLDVPALTGQEVVTCDNSRYSPSNPSDADRSGVVYSVPFYGPDGALKGCVSAVFLTSVLYDLLPDGNTSIRNATTGQTITGAGGGAAANNPDAVRADRPEASLPACDVSALRVRDDSAEWVLWHGLTNDDFEARAGVRGARFVTAVWSVASLGLCGALSLAFLRLGRESAAAEARKRELEALVVERTRQFEHSEARARTIIDTAMDAVVTLDDSARVTGWNRMAEVVFGYEAGEASGREASGFLFLPATDSPADISSLLNAARDATDGRAQVDGVRRDGCRFPAEISVSPVTVHGAVMYGLFIRDITGRLRAQEDLRTAREVAEAASRAKSEFLANMSHEIRTPMTAILGFADILRDNTLVEQARLEHIETISRNGEHLLAIINDILDLSKIEAGQMTLETLRVGTRSLVEELAVLLRPRAESKGLTFNVFIDGSAPPSLDTDPTRLKQVLVNLLGNAIKFTAQGAVSLRVVSEPEQPSSLRFEVTDTGIGMTEDQVSRIFRPFSQADPSMSRRFGGTGLGLSISGHLAKRLGGGITVRSQPGQGSTFSLTVGGATSASAQQTTTPTPAPAGTSPTPLAGVRVLLAEDGPDNQRLLGFILRRAGAELDIVENGERAVHAAPLSDPHVVLMDMQMTVLDGYAATAGLRAAGFRRPIIALTAHAMAGEREKCIAAGCDDYLTKPVDRERLIAAVLRWSTEPARG
ncbi:MAG: ATP-binding protein [Phycisphaerales bacterium]